MFEGIPLERLNSNPKPAKSLLKNFFFRFIIYIFVLTATPHKMWRCIFFISFYSLLLTPFPYLFLWMLSELFKHSSKEFNALNAGNGGGVLETSFKSLFRPLRTVNMTGNITVKINLITQQV